MIQPVKRREFGHGRFDLKDKEWEIIAPLHFRRIAIRFDKLARNFLAASCSRLHALWIRTYESIT